MLKNLFIISCVIGANAANSAYTKAMEKDREQERIRQQGAFERMPNDEEWELALALKLSLEEAKAKEQARQVNSDEEYARLLALVEEIEEKESARESANVESDAKLARLLAEEEEEKEKEHIDPDAEYARRLAEEGEEKEPIDGGSLENLDAIASNHEIQEIVKEETKRVYDRFPEYNAVCDGIKSLEDMRSAYEAHGTLEQYEKEHAQLSKEQKEMLPTIQPHLNMVQFLQSRFPGLSKALAKALLDKAGML